MLMINRHVLLTIVLLIGLSVDVYAAESSDSTIVDESLQTGETPPDEFAPVDMSTPDKSNTYQSKLQLARSLLQTNEYSDAEQVLENLVVEIEEAKSRYAPELSQPLRLLGEALHGEGDYPEAVDAYERAAHIMRIDQGLHSPEQAAIVYEEAESLLAMGNEAGANNKQEYAYEMLLRSYGPDSVETLPGKYKLAQWYMRTRNIFGARSLYGEAVLLLSKNYGNSTTKLLPALNGIANSYLLERFPPYTPVRPQGTISIESGSTGIAPITPRPATVVNRFSKGEQALQHAVRIRVDDPESTTAQKAEAVMRLADWYLMFKKMNRARSLYAHVRELLESDETTDQSELIRTYFDTPTMLYMPLPALAQQPLTGSLPAAAAKLGYIELQFDITAMGEVRRLKTLASEPEDMVDLKVRRAVRTARYRPRITEDGPEAVSGLTFRHEFRYYPRPEETTENLQATKN